MMKFLFPLAIIFVIVLIIGMVFIIKNLKNSFDKEQKGANIISFLFPIVGLIIYAVNIGKNDKLAKSCVKMALLGMAFGVILYIIVQLSLFGVYSFSKTETKTITKQKINTSEEILKADMLILEDYIKEDNKVLDCEVSVSGKIVNINVNYSYSLDEDDIKEHANSILDYLYDEKYKNYSIKFKAYNKSYSLNGTRIKNNNYIIWNE